MAHTLYFMIYWSESNDFKPILIPFDSSHRDESNGTKIMWFRPIYLKILLFNQNKLCQVILKINIK